jgi:hypothetical protein
MGGVGNLAAFPLEMDDDDGKRDRQVPVMKVTCWVHGRGDVLGWEEGDLGRKSGWKGWDLVVANRAGGVKSPHFVRATQALGGSE